jgi:hypothetical protein
MESWIFPHAGSHSTAGDRAGEPTLSRAFYERVRERALPRMAPALSVDGAEVRYFGAIDLALWCVRGQYGLVLAYECCDGPAQLADHARRWLGCLRTRTSPGMLDRTWDRPVYGVRHDAASDALEVVWTKPGDWCRFVLADEPQQRLWNLPPHWRQTELASV